MPLPVRFWDTYAVKGFHPRILLNLANSFPVNWQWLIVTSSSRNLWSVVFDWRNTFSTSDTNVYLLTFSCWHLATVSNHSDKRVTLSRHVTVDWVWGSNRNWKLYCTEVVASINPITVSTIPWKRTVLTDQNLVCGQTYVANNNFYHIKRCVYYLLD